jgi:hypothetical protein
MYGYNHMLCYYLSGYSYRSRCDENFREPPCP